MSESKGPSKDPRPAATESQIATGGLPPNHAGPPLDSPAPAASPSRQGAPALRSVGSYRLLQKIGEGGMGQVWLAQQTAPVKRQVALKLIKAGLYDNSVLHRFQSERQSLAIMDHPSIAKVFDAGATPDGQPYL